MKSRHVYRVAWSRDRWTASRGDNYRYYSRRSDGEAFIAKLIDPDSDDGPVDSWRIEHTPADWTVIASSSDTNQGRLEL